MTVPHGTLKLSHMDTTTPQRTRYNNRDRLGRFVRRVHIDQCTYQDGYVVSDDTQTGTTAHAHDRCGDIIKFAPVTGPNTRHSADADGWICGSCVFVPTPAWIAGRDTTPHGFMQTCTECNVEKKATSFPTELIAGWRFRGLSCRACNEAVRVPRKKKLDVVEPELVSSDQ